MKNAQPHKNAEPSVLDSRNLNGQPKFTPRQERVLHALWHATGWLWRETIDRIAKASNGPEIIRQLRHDHLIEIEMRKVKIIDADGRPSRPGRYRLTEKGRGDLPASGWMPQGQPMASDYLMGMGGAEALM